ncbi:SLBB domain-containing protein [Lacihabitans lacunae]|uniref:SLBB domain-containing protein n=1 Tax=Lacihabitans lacunae TaxID=1028214 RepID=A0ABV7Z2F3_9BACT
MLTKTYILLSFFLIISFTTAAQSVDDMSDKEIISFLQKAQESGMSEEQIISIAATKGYTASDISKFKDRINKIQSPKNTTNTNSQLVSRSVDSTQIISSNKTRNESVVDKAAEERRSKIFGLNIFNNQTLNFEPNLNIATPKNYILGTNDEISIDITGYAYAHYESKVSPDGTIKIENLSPIFVAGQTLEQAKTKITQRLKSIFGGLGSKGLNADVSLTKIRSISVTVIGEAVFPGTYTVPSLATTFNLLYAAGGPTDIGSMRAVEVFRKGRKIKTLDLYDFLLHGDLKDDISLLDQDVVMIPYVDKRVIINGAVRNPKIYEIKQSETLANALKYAGGFNEMAYTKSVRINRATLTEKKILTVSKDLLNSFILEKGDMITVDSLLEKYENKVSISGAAYKNGDFELVEGMRISQLINQAEGLKPTAFKERAFLRRESANGDTEIISLNLNDLPNEKSNVLLKKNDVLEIKSIDETREKMTVQVDGEINTPSLIPFTENLTVSDAILLTGGLKYGANPSRIEIARRINMDEGDSEQNIEILKINIDPKLGILPKDKETKLQPFDRVYIRKLARYETQKIVTITGEINYPGPYALNDKKERISDLLEKAGGVKSLADLASAKFVRGGIQMGLDLKKIEIDKSNVQNLLLEPGDVLEIPRRKETVTISGNVYNPITVPYQEGLSLKKYLNYAGGTNDSAYVKKIYVKYGNGKLNNTKSFLGIKSYPKIENGSEIIVPIYKKQRWTAAERISVSSAVISISTVLISIVLRVIP